jgi:dUTP pyrophosphatase
MKVYLSKVPNSWGIIPTKAHTSDAGWDLYTSRNQLIEPGSKRDVHTDICIAMPDGWFAMIQGRSSTANKWGLIVLQGIVDAGYRGEMFIQVFNPLPDPVEIYHGVRLAQLIFLPVPSVEWNLVDHLPDSPRGPRGFGHSGV